MDNYQVVKRARQIDRLSTLEMAQALCDEFIECHGDRRGGDDPAMVGGIGMMADQPITIIGIQKGKNVIENVRRKFGSSGPNGYRKAQRLMLQAEKFNRPVVTFINTAGAHCSPESEQGGIGEAIAQSLTIMSELTVPTLAIILGEGGSGGAIALALADQVWMLENAVYSILSPEGFSSILWKDASYAREAANVMKLTSHELYDLKIIDRIILETDAEGNALTNDILCHNLVKEIRQTIQELVNIPASLRIQQKYQRFRKY